MIMDWDAIKVIGPSTVVGILTLVGTFYTMRGKEKSDKLQQNLNRDQAQMTLDASTAQNLTERYKALMNGYEGRIDDLSDELKDQRIRMRTLEREFSAHRSICSGCATFQQYMKEHPNAFPAAE
jgi:hypothetical protein